MNTASDYIDWQRACDILDKTLSYLAGTSSISIAYVTLITIFVYYLLLHLDYPILPMSELLWSSLVYITPVQLLTIVESILKLTPEGKSKNELLDSSSKTHAKKSEKLRRIFGLDGTGILAAVQQTTSIPKIGTLLQTRSKSSPPGLGNWDNSCYQNSIIQGLASLPSFSDFLASFPSLETLKSTGTALKEIIGKLNDPEKTGQMFWTPAELKSMSSWQQQDAQEYYSKVLDEVDKEAAMFMRQNPSSGGLGTFNKLSHESSQSLPSSQEGSNINRVKAAYPPSFCRDFSQLPEEVQSIVVRNPLDGLLAQRVGCLRCGYVEGFSLTPFNCLTVPLGKQRIYDVRTCLDDYTALEEINDVECAKCTLLANQRQLKKLREQLSEPVTDESCPSESLVTNALRISVEERLEIVTDALDNDDYSDNTINKKCQIPSRSKASTTKSRQAVIARSPKSLVIHINRSVFDETTGFLSKNSADVRFPLRFNLASWCLGGCSPIDEERSGTEHWSIDPAESMLPDDDLDDIPPGKMSYVLRAVVTHYGRHENGHYICYRRYPSRSNIELPGSAEVNVAWWRFSDEDVSLVSQEDVLLQGGVFMLFYEKASVSPGVPISSESIQELRNEKLNERNAQYAEAQAEDEVTDDDTASSTTLMGDENNPTEATITESFTGPDNAHSSATSNDQAEKSGLEEEASTSPDSNPKVTQTPVNDQQSPTPSLPPTSASPTSDPASETPPTTTVDKDPAIDSASTKGETSTPPPSLAPLISLLKTDDTPLKENNNHALTPPMRTATPRSGRKSASRSTTGIGQVSSMVTSH